MSLRGTIRNAVVLLMIGFCLTADFFRHEYANLQIYLLFFYSVQSIILIYLAIWQGFLLFSCFRPDRIPLIGLLCCAGVSFILVKSTVSTGCFMLMLGATLGAGIKFLLGATERKTGVIVIAAGLNTVFTLSICFQFSVLIKGTDKLRWAGLWDNPNAYGILMGTGLVLTTGLLPEINKEECMMKNSEKKPKTKNGKRKSIWFVAAFKSLIGHWRSAILWVATFMIGAGLVMSYSRGAWLATAVALIYLTWCYGKLKWRYLLPVVLLIAVTASLLWSRTPDSAPWYVKRADLGRPSAQHRVTAWEAGLKIMRDHPFGVGWNNAVPLYEKSYSPPENGAAALTTNDYLMIGTELGIPALLCFICYAVLCLRGKPKIETEAGRIQATCRAGAIVFLVAFWFDGGLFKLPTAALFWVLLELGANRGKEEVRMQNAEV